MSIRIVATVLVGSLLPSAAMAGPCIQWRAPQKVGAMDPQLVREASGLAASRLHPGRLYHNNDSGDGPYFYLTDAQGGATQRVAVSGFVPRDVEEIALGRCVGAASCLFLGDIGDNAQARPSVTFVEVEELPEFAEEIAPLRSVEARYPDGPHNAESFAIHPNGDLYLITKASDFQTRTSTPAQIFRLTAAQLAAPAGEIQTFALVGMIDLPALVSDGFVNQTATAMDISPDGARTLILTYRNVIEWNRDLSAPGDGLILEPGRDYTITPLAAVIQAEAVAYLAEGDGITYSTELAPPATEAPLYRQMCARR